MGNPKPIITKTGHTVSGHGYTEKVKPLKNPTYLPKKKITQKEAGIKVLTPFDN